jgi:hypothetical protein
MYIAAIAAWKWRSGAMARAIVTAASRKPPPTASSARFSLHARPVVSRAYETRKRSGSLSASTAISVA